MKEAFKFITDVYKISFNSFRSGGASAAANAGIPDCLFKRHGRWASKNSKAQQVLRVVLHRAGIFPLSICYESARFFSFFSSYGYSFTPFILVSSFV